MKKPEQLDKLALVNETREKDAGRQLASDNLQHEALQQQLDKLKAYRDEYKEKLNKEMGTMESAHTIRDYHNFIRVLDRAIKEQFLAVEGSAGRLQHSKDNWIHSKGEVKKIEEMQDRSSRQLRKEEVLMEQKQSDEMYSNRLSHS